MSTFSALQRQRDLFLVGLSGQRPVIPTDPEQLAEAARAKMSAEAYAYVAGGAGRELTVVRNRSAFAHYAITPRMLCDVSQADTTVELFGRHIPAPILLSPVGVLELAHPAADLAVGKAAASVGLPFIFSNQASIAMEEVSVAMGSSPRWFQLYWSKSNELVASLVRRAEACGCEALVVTLDTTMLGWRPRDLDLGYLPFLRGMGLAQYISDPVFQALLDEPEEAGLVTPQPKVNVHTLRALIQLMQRYPGSFWGNLRSKRPLRAVRQFINMYTKPSLHWDELAFLREHTQLPILLKGILHPEDAHRAQQLGIDGLIISNHGGRQVDGAVSTIEMLPQIRTTVGANYPLLLDSGVRTGADVFKALALGANAICIGRPYVYGLVLDGQAGVQTVLENLWADFELTMRLSGCRTVGEVRNAVLRA
ncbi:MAG: lactate 2-monooxygenase [Bacteroidetes bacterium]|nr:MAG: lactate 2-monooxygenase [Bacteroidota bacterium]